MTLYLSHSFLSKKFGGRGKRVKFTTRAQIQFENRLQVQVFRKLVENVSLDVLEKPLPEFRVR